ncbi:Snf7-domain-containing protein [Coccomyxa subellipsoidea C-169]|uniref:Snf7-domain-containing protein n=1 Tax=Coccomyxa subellipsoidea (strain C-169) TaxID=574566 RepID=I0YJN9_COCSC|nr:Snf7-domain-containing protein [Coccomyxa subellipsoidea C-169]EIE18608.1 Snf7-domain-containing protein [Coccomyxa subellipsoidea C-169]|eukprot:XP_005643152.1 Snf7-domain-containing protein [Coccomyxa subellipsoidea C-169]
MFPENRGLLNYFRKQPDPKELVRKWQADIRAQQRALDRQIRDIERDRKLAEKQVKDAAKRGDIQSAKTLAKEIVHTKKAISRLYVNKAHFISMNSQLTEQLGLAKVAGTLSKSTEIMKIVNDLMKAPQLMQTMQQMSKEMMKAGILDEMMSDMMDSTMDEDIEEETEEEVDKVLMEIAGETLEQLAGSAAPRQKQKVKVTQAAEVAPEEDEALQARLDAVRS